MREDDDVDEQTRWDELVASAEREARAAGSWKGTPRDGGAGLMDELVAFLQACLREEEREARAADLMFGRPTSSHYEPWDRHIARWDPSRVLAEVEAKRRILGLHEPSQWGSDPALTCGTCSEGLGLVPWPCATVLALAQSYAGRPGFKDEWRLT